MRLEAWGSASQDLPARSVVRERLEGILSSGEYDVSPTAGVSRSFWSWLGEKLRDLFSGLTDLQDSAPGLFWIILIGCFLVLGLIVAHASTVLLRAIRASRPVLGGPAPRGPGREDPHALLDRARTAAGEGRLLEALALGHRAALAGLDRRGLVRLQESFTIGDVRRQLRRHREAARAYGRLAAIYEPAAFGRAPLKNADCESGLTAAGSLVGGGA